MSAQRRLEEVARVMLRAELFETRDTRLLVSFLITLTAMVASLLLAPGVGHAYEVHISMCDGRGREPAGEELRLDLQDRQQLGVTPRE